MQNFTHVLTHNKREFTNTYLDEDGQNKGCSPEVVATTHYFAGTPDNSYDIYNLEHRFDKGDQVVIITQDTTLTLPAHTENDEGPEDTVTIYDPVKAASLLTKSTGTKYYTYPVEGLLEAVADHFHVKISYQHWFLTQLREILSRETPTDTDKKVFLFDLACLYQNVPAVKEVVHPKILGIFGVMYENLILTTGLPVEYVKKNIWAAIHESGK